MIGNRFRDIYFVFFTFLTSTMIILIALLFIEYRFFCNQAQQLVALKQQYYRYLHDIEQKTSSGFNTTDNTGVDNATDLPMPADELSAAEASDDPDDDDEYIDESIVIINRESEYLKQSTLDYVQSQDLNSLMTVIDMDQWSNYTDKTACAIAKKKDIITKLEVTSKPQVKISAVRSPTKNFGLEWPIDKDKFWLSSLFGARKRINGTWGFHHGIDMAAVKGTVVKAARNGVIVEACFQTGYGNTVVIAHNATVKTRYAHLHAIRARVGQRVTQGTVVGTVGETGFIRKKGKDGSHLHFEVYEHGKRINPMHCLPRTV